MDFGLQFFPDQWPDAKPPAQYFDESLRLVGLCDQYGYTHVRIVEHYFHLWGGNSPNPIVFLSAASQRTRTARMITGAVLPAFNNPLKLAGEIGMLDAIAGGRLDVGFARAFLPYEFRHFKVPMDESNARFEEGIEQVRLLLEGENVSSAGRFHSFKDVTSLPRPTQKPRPNFYIAAIATPSSFERAGRMGHAVMAIPGIGPTPTEFIGIYREAWKSAGHKGKPKVMFAVFMFCHEDREEAIRIAKPRIEGHMASMMDAVAEWAAGPLSKDYPNYEKMYHMMKEQNFATQVAHRAAYVGTPKDLIEQFHAFDTVMGGIDSASLQVNPNDMPIEHAEASVRLFGETVIPHFAKQRVAAE